MIRYKALLIGIDFPPQLSLLLGGHAAFDTIVHALHPAEVKTALQKKVDLIFISLRSYDYRLFSGVETGAKLVFVGGHLDKLALEWVNRGQLFIREPFSAQKITALVQRCPLTAVPRSFESMIGMHGRAWRQWFFEDIDLIQRIGGNYIRLCHGGQEYLVAGTLTAMQEKLPAAKLVRVSDALILPASVASSLKGNIYEYKGRRIPLTRRFVNGKAFTNPAATT